MKQSEVELVKELIEKHLKAEKHHLEKIEQADGFLMEIKDPDDFESINLWEHVRLNSNKLLRAQREMIKDLACIIQADVKFTRKCDKMLVGNPAEVIFNDS